MTFAEKNWGDCSKAVAYELNFVQLCYSYESDCSNDYFEVCPKCGTAIRQNRDYEYPKSDFSKKDYYILDHYNYGVSEKLRNELIEYGIAYDNFRPIYTRKKDKAIGYQIVPKYKLPPIYMYNGEVVESSCKLCGMKQYEYNAEIDSLYDDKYDDYFFEMRAYKGKGYPSYIPEEMVDKIQSLNGLEGEASPYTVIISLDLYNYLLEKYPRIECRPVFTGDVSQDKEYIRIFELKKQIDEEMAKK